MQDFERDLVILVPDRTFRLVVSTLIRRHASLEIRPVSHDIQAHTYFDAGCLRDCHEFLKPFLQTHCHALVFFDKHGCGREDLSADMLQLEVEERLRRSGWEDRACAIVVEPELEVWVWSDSPEVERCLGWAGRQPPLRERLRQKGLWEPGSAKPTDPKAAMALALREAGIAPARAAFERLAASVGLRRCTDRAFVRFRGILQRWFPAKGEATG
ncbi:MAG: hypothetical protein FJ291_21580 [Planctomycetes bacterium]|nr:hypothetical protein [Planctomycetota bacterium]